MQLRAEILSKPSSRQSDSDALITDELATDVQNMRQKMRNNLNKSDTKLWDIKQGEGGLVDIEFLVQYWALKYSRDLVQNVPNARLPFNNVDWLQLLTQHGFISQDVRDQLIQNYRTFREIANHNSLQSQPQLIPKNELEHEKQQVSELWHSTFKSSEVE